MSERVSLGSPLPYFFEMNSNKSPPVDPIIGGVPSTDRGNYPLVGQGGVYYLEGMDLQQPQDSDLPDSV